MRERRVRGYLLSALLVTLAVPACGPDGGSSFCGDWATAFCRKLAACDPNAGPSESECVRGFAMLCSQPGQNFDVNCYGKQVNEAAKTSCLNRLSTVACDEFNSATYDDDCDLVCTAGGTGGTSGTGGGGGTGGSGGGSGCGSVAPCGGSIAATWSITGICVTPQTMNNPNCPGGTLTITGATESGTLSFTSAGTYTANVTATVSIMDTTPSSCIAPATCADLAAAYVAEGASATCTGTSVCNCTIVIASSGSEAGTYTTSGTTLTITDSTGEVDSMGYCVQGDTLHLTNFNTAGQVASSETAQRLQ